MSLRPKLRALQVLIRGYLYPLTLHVPGGGPLVVQRMHSLNQTIKFYIHGPSTVAGGCATLLYRVPDLTVTSHNTHPSGHPLNTNFTVAGVTHCHAKVYYPAGGDPDTLQEILDWVWPYLPLKSARAIV